MRKDEGPYYHYYLVMIPTTEHESYFKTDTCLPKQDKFLWAKHTGIFVKMIKYSHLFKYGFKFNLQN